MTDFKAPEQNTFTPSGQKNTNGANPGEYIDNATNLANQGVPNPEIPGSNGDDNVNFAQTMLLTPPNASYQNFQPPTPNPSQSSQPIATGSISDPTILSNMGAGNMPVTQPAFPAPQTPIMQQNYGGSVGQFSAPPVATTPPPVAQNSAPPLPTGHPGAQMPMNTPGQINPMPVGQPGAANSFPTPPSIPGATTVSHSANLGQTMSEISKQVSSAVNFKEVLNESKHGYLQKTYVLSIFTKILGGFLAFGISSYFAYQLFQYNSFPLRFVAEGSLNDVKFYINATKTCLILGVLLLALGGIVAAYAEYNLARTVDQLTAQLQGITNRRLIAKFGQYAIWSSIAILVVELVIILFVDGITFLEYYKPVIFIVLIVTLVDWVLNTLLHYKLISEFDFLLRKNIIQNSVLDVNKLFD